MIGEIIEKYEVLEKIGEGGMASVYLGRHTTLGRKVAIKVLHPHLASSAKNRTRFAREAHAIESLRHPNILRIFDYSGPESDRCFIVTEYIEGPTLREVLDQVGVVMAEPAALIARELCDAMQTAHNEGIVHRDLKPENVMINEAGAVKLMDFGIARIVDDSHVTMTGALVGSPAYMSPEQATDSEVDHRSDLFALGIVMYRMVTGSLPFRGGNPSVVLKAIIDGNFQNPTERVPSLSPAMTSIILRCLSSERDKRYSSALEVRADLDAFLLSVDIDPEQPGRWNVESFLSNAEGYEDNLLQHLMTALVERGKTEVSRKDTAAALRTFHRVLALDGDNREVIEIIEGMRPPSPSDTGRTSSRMLWWGVAAVLTLALSVIGITGDRLQTGDLDLAPLPRIAPVPMLAIPIAERAPVVEEKAAVEETTEPTEEEVPATIKDRPEARGSTQKESPATRPTTTQKVVPSKTTSRPPQTPRSETSTPPLEDRETAAAEPPPTIPAGTGRLRIITLNGAGQVFINGEYIDWTPMNPVSLPSGRHEVVLPETAYHFEHRETVTILPDEDNEKTIIRRYKPARVRFEEFPPDATLEMNGEDMGTLGEKRDVMLNERGEFQFTVRDDRSIIKRISITCGVESKDLMPGTVQVVKP